MAKYKKNKTNNYRSQDDGYHYIEDRNCEFINGSYRLSAGFDFYVPFDNIFPNPKDYFAIRDEWILVREINNIINNPYMCTEDIIRVLNVKNKHNNLCEDIRDTMIGNKQSHDGRQSIADITAFRFVYRFINKYDSNGILIRPDDIILNKLIDYIFKAYKNHIIVASTNKFTNTVHFLISNLIGNQELLEEYDNYYHKYGKNNKTNILLTSNIYTKLQNIQNNTERFLYFKPKM